MSIDQALKGMDSIRQVRASGDGVFWLAGIAAEDGRMTVRRWREGRITEITEPRIGPAASKGPMRTQEMARFIGTRMRTGTTWNCSPRGSVMYMPRGCLPASTAT